MGSVIIRVSVVDSGINGEGVMVRVSDLAFCLKRTKQDVPFTPIS
jgi:hypothetical protein